MNQQLLMSIGGGIKPYSDVVLEDAPWLYWRLEETSGASVADSSGNSRGGTVAGSATRGVNGNSANTGLAINLTAATQYVYAGNSGADVFGNVTMECFIKANSLTGGRQCIGCFGAQTSRPGYFMYLTDATISLEYHENFANFYVMAATGTIADTDWHHIVAVYTKVSSGNYPLNGNLYLDGVSVASGLIKNYEFGGITHNVQALGNSTDVNAQFIGSLNEFAIYMGLLSTARIAAHYAAK